MKSIKTTNIKGGEYATVADRLVEFRTQNPRASIETNYEELASGSIVFKARIKKDQADEFSAEATGTAMYRESDVKKDKAFEKLETIAVGRALSLIDYTNKGIIATGEEMEEFEQLQAERRLEETKEASERIAKATTLDELTKIYSEHKTNPEVFTMLGVRKREILKELSKQEGKENEDN